MPQRSPGWYGAESIRCARSCKRGRYEDANALHVLPGQNQDEAPTAGPADDATTRPPRQIAHAPGRALRFGNRTAAAITCILSWLGAAGNRLAASRSMVKLFSCERVSILGSPGLLVTLMSRHFRFAAKRASVTVEESHDDRVAWSRV